VLATGATLVAPAPRRPREGLAAMRKHTVTHASATPTYWRFLLAEMRSDGGAVPDLRQMTLGGEAIPPFLLAELTASFPNAKISQVYAASEFGSSGSVRDRRNGLPLSVLERSDDADVQMRIVDGELWVRSRVGMIGYYDEDIGDADGWRATGDLVAVEGDRIIFQGRTSDIINVGGVKVHPLPIEERVSKVPGVAMARVYGRRSPVTGAIVAVEVIPEPDVDTDDLSDAIREACGDLVAAARPRSIRFVDEISTVGHKIVRGTVGAS
jgi:acyl-coenzyme A synthetase/AMP-(fatty) acid ligase